MVGRYFRFKLSNLYHSGNFLGFRITDGNVFVGFLTLGPCSVLIILPFLKNDYIRYTVGNNELVESLGPLSFIQRSDIFTKKFFQKSNSGFLNSEMKLYH
jgi:hypothetical protein